MALESATKLLLFLLLSLYESSHRSCGLMSVRPQAEWGTAHMRGRGRMLGFSPAVVLLVWERKSLHSLAELSCRNTQEGVEERYTEVRGCNELFTRTHLSLASDATAVLKTELQLHAINRVWSGDSVTRQIIVSVIFLIKISNICLSRENWKLFSV